MNDKNLTDSYDLDETKKELDLQAILVGNGKNTLVFESTPTSLSEILVKQNCKVKKIIIKENNPLEDLLDSEKFDVIVLGDFLQCIEYLLTMNLKELIAVWGTVFPGGKKAGQTKKPSLIWSKSYTMNHGIQ